MSVPRLENCRVCGDVFIASGRLLLCEKCRLKLDEVHAKARRKLREGKADVPLSSLELAEALGVDPLFIQILVEEGLLERREGDPSLDRSGRSRLAAEFSSELRRLNGQDEKGQTPAEGMFFNRRRRQEKED